MKPELRQEMQEFSGCVRGFTAFLVVLFSGPLILVCFYVWKSKTIYEDLLKGAALPPLTQWAVLGRFPLTALSLLIPLVAVFVVFKVSSHKYFFTIQAFLIISIIGLVWFLLVVLFSPLVA